MAFNGSGAASGATSGASAGASFGPWGAAIGGIAGGLIGGLAGKKGEKESVAEQYAYNLALQKQAQKWQEHMASTAYQRTKKDLLSSGYNPLIAVTNGTNSAPSASINSVSKDNRGAIIQKAIQDSVSNALEMRLKLAQAENVEADTDSKTATISNILGKFLNGKGQQVIQGIKNLGNLFTSNAKEAKEIGSNVLKATIKKYGTDDEINEFLNREEIDDFDRYIRQKYKVRNGQIRNK